MKTFNVQKGTNIYTFINYRLNSNNDYSISDSREKIRDNGCSYVYIFTGRPEERMAREP